MRIAVHKPIRFRVSGCPEYGKYQVALRFPERTETDFRMLFDVAASLVVHQQAEHRAVRHVMAVDHQIGRVLRQRMADIQEQCTRLAAMSVKNHG